MVLVLTGALALASAVSAANVTVRPKATDEALINPDMGFVYYKYSNRLWAYGINTPEIALPLEGQIGATRRYAVGEICVK